MHILLLFLDVWLLIHGILVHGKALMNLTISLGHLFLAYVKLFYFISASCFLGLSISFINLSINPLIVVLIEMKPNISR